MNSKQETWWKTSFGLSRFSVEEAFSREDETTDEVFYARDRLVRHLDDTALETIERCLKDLITVESPIILDLMASWDSHLPKGLKPAKVVGLGLNRNELEANKALDGITIHDLNRHPELPYESATFDVVINTVSVDYLVRPIDVFSETARVLKPGGLFVVIFSNRMFPQKATRIWKESSEEERIMLVEDFFRESGGFEKAHVFVSRNKPRPAGDKYASTGLPSDPVYVVYALKTGAGIEQGLLISKGDIATMEKKQGLDERMKEVKQSLCCPYCGEKLKKWEVPDNPFSQTWDNDFMYICFNDGCEYYVRGWEVIARQQNKTSSYRLMYNPQNDCCLPIPVPTSLALRESIIE
jgi:SAM-dependent methyltransferase